MAICVFLCQELCCVLCDVVPVKQKPHIFWGWLIKEVCTWDSNTSSRTSTRDCVGVYQTIDWYLVLLIISKIFYVLYRDKNDTPQKNTGHLSGGSMWNGCRRLVKWR
jgi:hypothetical protein